MEYFRNLKMLIEETYVKNENKKVIIVVHSFGGPVSLAFLRRQNQKWKDKYIKYLISLSGAWAGAIKAIESFVAGNYER